MSNAVEDIDISKIKAKSLYIEVEDGLPVIVQVTEQGSTLWVTVRRNLISGMIVDETGGKKGPKLKYRDGGWEVGT